MFWRLFDYCTKIHNNLWIEGKTRPRAFRQSYTAVPELLCNQFPTKPYANECRNALTLISILHRRLVWVPSHVSDPIVPAKNWTLVGSYNGRIPSPCHYQFRNTFYKNIHWDLTSSKWYQSGSKSTSNKTSLLIADTRIQC